MYDKNNTDHSQQALRGYSFAKDIMHIIDA